MLRYDPRLKGRARSLRANLTDAEQRLWARLRRKQILSVQFYRQKPIGNYIADFYAPAVRLIVEVDGSQHFNVLQAQYDRRRTEYLKRLGLRVLRFTDRQVLLELDSVMKEIFRTAEEKIPLNLPLHQRGKFFTHHCPTGLPLFEKEGPGEICLVRRATQRIPLQSRVSQ
jgi:very-short-patch-repair endonuclease